MCNSQPLKEKATKQIPSNHDPGLIQVFIGVLLCHLDSITVVWFHTLCLHSKLEKSTLERVKLIMSVNLPTIYHLPFFYCFVLYLSLFKPQIGEEAYDVSQTSLTNQKKQALLMCSL